MIAMLALFFEACGFPVFLLCSKPEVKANLKTIIFKDKDDF